MGEWQQAMPLAIIPQQADQEQGLGGRGGILMHSSSPRRNKSVLEPAVVSLLP